MEQYHNTVKEVLTNGSYKPNRTAADTIATFGTHYTIDVSKTSFPLLTTKDMLGFRWNSLIHEFFWFLSGEEHIRNLQEETKLWNAWADDNGRLDTAYGRFWRRYPIPDEASHLDGESWTIDPNKSYVNEETVTEDEFVSTNAMPVDAGEKRYTIDQIEYVLDQLQNNPHTRRMVVTAWHPGNTVDSTLPPCHYTFVLNVQGSELNLHLTQRSGDTALGVPFNIAGYSLLLLMLAQESGFEPGEFSHTIVDTHIYCGTHERGDWYGENIEELHEKVKVVEDTSLTSNLGTFSEVADWIEQTAPPERDGNENMDHVPGLLRQLDREPRSLPCIELPDKSIDEMNPEDIEIMEYEPYDGISFGVAE